MDVATITSLNLRCIGSIIVIQLELAVAKEHHKQHTK